MFASRVNIAADYNSLEGWMPVGMLKSGSCYTVLLLPVACVDNDLGHIGLRPERLAMTIPAGFRLESVQHVVG